ncbi:MAG: hypothetical protein RL603_1658 [Pseudomonadota bacterium]
MTSCGVYVHFPWCVRKCPYCDFNSHAVRDEGIPETAYVDALLADLESQLDPQGALLQSGGAHAFASRRIASVFLGGGTPSLFSPAAIARVLEGLRARLSFEADVEVTLEANPGTIERGRFAEYAAAGVNRVSLGAQTFSAQALLALGRIHAAEDTQRAAEELHAAGLSNFNLDLMYALPQQDVAGAIVDVERALALAPAQISHYQLTLEPNTAFAARPPEHLPDDDTVAAMLEAARARLEAAGYARYEVSAYARAGRECRHNLGYWRYGDYLGLGAGAHGKCSWPSADDERDATTRSADVPALRVRRSVQARDPRKFLRDPRAALSVIEVTPAERPFEFMLNALRLPEGTTRLEFERATGVAWTVLAPALERAGAAGLLIGDLQRAVRPSERGYAFLNDLLLEFLGPGQAASPAMHSP